jgi:sec-independent protein translocase protein TatA
MGLDNPLHLAFLVMLLLLVFGAKRLPEMGRSLGAGMRGFRESVSGEHTGAQEPALAAAQPSVQNGVQPAAPAHPTGATAADEHAPAGVAQA